MVPDTSYDKEEKKSWFSLASLLQLIAVVLIFVCLVLISLVFAKLDDDDDVAVVTNSPSSASGVADPTGWSYRDHGFVRGPAAWHESYGDCAGLEQSPIDLPPVHKALSKASSALGDSLSMNGLCTSYEGAVTDNTWKAKHLDDCPDGNLTLTLGETQYTLLQFHLHTPSEHTIDGKHYSAEIHFVFGTGSNFAVLGVMLEATSHADNPFLADFFPNFDGERHNHPGIDYFSFIPGKMKHNYADNTESFKTGSYYSYDGSFTTPPCTEGVKWHVFTTPVAISFEQYNHYLRALPNLPQTQLSLFNNRPIMPLNGRTVTVNVDIGYDYSDTSTLAPGPAEWANIPGTVCNGEEQSPVDLPEYPEAIMHADSSLGEHLSMGSGLCTKYVGAVKTNTWQVDNLNNCDQGQLYLSKYGNAYTLLQFHLHTPSEHTVGGKYFDAEIHFVFADANSNLAVIGVFLDAEFGQDNEFLADFWDNFDDMEHDHSGIDFMSFFPSHGDKLGAFYSYDGSLTTPPCSEGVKWHVMLEPVKISQKQFDKYKVALSELPKTYSTQSNERPVQPLNARTVSLNTDIGYDYSEVTTYAPGPSEWANIEGSECAGSEQSPIDLPELNVGLVNTGSHLGDLLSITGLCTKYMGEVKGNVWEVAGLRDCSQGNLYLSAYDSVYTLLQFHIHTPSEHTVNGKYFDAEVHFVFIDGSNNLAVIGIFLEAEEGAENEFLAEFWPNFDHHEHDHPGMDFLSFFPKEHGHSSEPALGSYYSYDGSLTTPPCSEGVKWHVMAQPVKFSQKQFDQYKHALTMLPQTYDTLSNERPAQPLNARTVAVNTDITYDYDDTTTWAAGPATWASLEGTECAGSEQSPVDLPETHHSVTATGSDFGDYLSMTAGFCTSYIGEVKKNVWEVAGLNTCDQGKLHLNRYGSLYTLLQFHIHTPSEHTVGGKYFDAEVHFVFIDDNSNLAVIGVFLEAEQGAENEFLAQFWDNFDNHEHELPSGINYFDFLPTTAGDAPGAYYSYDGSLTTPPCSEGVKWHVMTQPVKFSQKQFDMYKKALATMPQTYSTLSNERPVQPLNARTVTVNSDIGYDYSEETTHVPGPSTWATAYPECAGQEQSPINLPEQSPAVVEAKSSFGDYLSMNGTCTKFYGGVNYHTWKVGHLDECEEGKLHFDLYGNSYTLAQFHFHAPSEHTVNGLHYDAEAHFVFVDANSNLAVVGVFLDASYNEENAFLAQFWDHFDNQEHEIPTGIDYFSFFPGEEYNGEFLFPSYYSYDGSLTTPPCSEGVKWHVMTQPVKISQAQLDKYHTAMAGYSQTYSTLRNARPIQVWNERSVKTNVAVDWDYSEATSIAAGQSGWAQIYPDCNGQEQSPVDLPAATGSGSGNRLDTYLTIDGLCTSYYGKRNEHTWKVDRLSECTTGALKFDRYGNSYTLAQFHLHSPSEHTIDGKYYSAEAHFVFVDSTGASPKYAVVGVMLEANSPTDNAFLAQFWDNFDNKEHELPSGIDYFSFWPGTYDGTTYRAAPHYTYDGSFTTPPCTEGVKWHVFTEPVSISPAQLNAYKKDLGMLVQTFDSLSNERAIQDLNGRVPNLNN